jgi:HK97 family phage prohead protease
MEGRIDTTFNDGRQACSLVKQGIGRLSIGYRPVRVQQHGKVRHLRQIDLAEVSLTVWPMNPDAQVTFHEWAVPVFRL